MGRGSEQQGEGLVLGLGEGLAESGPEGRGGLRAGVGSNVGLKKPV